MSFVMWVALWTPGFSRYCGTFKPSRESLGEDAFHSCGNLMEVVLEEGSRRSAETSSWTARACASLRGLVPENVFCRVPGEEYEEVYEEELEEELESDGIGE